MAKTITKIGLWRGKPVEKLTKEELLNIIKRIGEDNWELRKQAEELAKI